MTSSSSTRKSEFSYLTEALGGEVIRISATSDTHINALDMDRAYGDERNPIVSKSEGLCCRCSNSSSGTAW